MNLSADFCSTISVVAVALWWILNGPDGGPTFRQTSVALVPWDSNPSMSRQENFRYGVVADIIRQVKMFSKAERGGKGDRLGGKIMVLEIRISMFLAHITFF